MTQLLYLHGFASSPHSKKARIFLDKFREVGVKLRVPDLTPEGLAGMTLTGMLDVVERAADSGPVSLIGSSLGGYLAALYAARHDEVERVVLLAPAFGFARLYAEGLGAEKMARWEREGRMEVMDYRTGAMTDLGWELMEDARRYEEEPALLQPCLIYHGTNDTVVPVQVSRAFARTKTCSELREMESGHELLDVVDEVWEGTREFLLGE